MTKENLHAESRSVGRATYREPFLLRENATGKLADFTTSFAFIIDGKNRTSYGEGLAFFLAPNGSLLNRALGKGSSLGLPVNSSLENVIEPSNDYPFVAVEFDTYRNSWPTVKDPDGDHIAMESGYSNATNSSKITESSAMESGYGNATNSSEITESSATNSHQQFRLGKE
ncbi:lectin-related protein-like [Prunus avium]|uniref:Lectin-related protein-like n=1 Tax=Prunus avium TaxID=42229 RepID=A0A6P5TGL1_PRUAV|nr:lectin-related protein-like [Prunus avium]